MKILDTIGVTTLINIIKNNFAKSNSPTLTGTPTAPTASAGTNTTQIATTAFVQTAVTGFLTSDSTLNAAKLSGTIPTACYTDTTYSVATTSNDGLMSSSDKTTLNGISTTYVAQTSVGNAANKIPVYSAEGHLVLPNGIEIY